MLWTVWHHEKPAVADEEKVVIEWEQMKVKLNSGKKEEEMKVKVSANTSVSFHNLAWTYQSSVNLFKAGSWGSRCTHSAAPDLGFKHEHLAYLNIWHSPENKICSIHCVLQSHIPIGFIPRFMHSMLSCVHDYMQISMTLIFICSKQNQVENQWLTRKRPGIIPLYSAVHPSSLSIVLKASEQSFKIISGKKKQFFF